MPYEFHPNLVTPPDSTVLWRYLDFAKLLDMLERQVLWFPRADTFEDPLEAGWTDSEIEHLRSLPSVPTTPFGNRLAGEFCRARAFSLAIFISCWRAGAHESMAMWDVYRTGGSVIALKSTVGLLKEAVSHFNKPVNIGEVRYTDWNEAPWDNNLVVMCVRKELAYMHEAEVRAVILDTDQVGVKAPPLGIDVPFDHRKFITEVVVGPREKEWILALVKRVMNRYGFQQQVTISNLLRPRMTLPGGTGDA
jgi:hypothetical protein